VKKCLPPFVAFVLFCAVQAIAAPEFEWVFSGGGKSHDKTRAVNIDAQGNTLLAGEFTGPANFGQMEVTGAGLLDFCVAKCDPQGKVLWVRTGGGSGTDRAYAVAADAQGNVFAGGHYDSTDAAFSGVKLPQAGGYDGFVAKYDGGGKLQWIRTAGGTGYDYIHALAVDGEGNVVVSGAIVGNAEFGDVRVEGAGSRLFCAKYDTHGKLLWVKATTGAASGSGHGIAVDGAGNIYVGGMNRGVGAFGDKPLHSPSGQDSLVAKLNRDGEVLWVALNHGASSCLVHEITCDAQGRVWASGMFKGTATFAEQTVSSGGDKDSDAFIAHYNTDGALKWARFGQSSGTDYGLGVATDRKGQSFLCGTFAESFVLAGGTLQSRGGVDIYVAAFSESGALNWLTQAGGKGGDNAYSMVYAGERGLVLGGAFSAAANFGQIEVQDTGGSDLYAAKLKVSQERADQGKQPSNQ